MTYPAWTPASRPGIIPLHPLTFGTILGRSFSALRHNPRVLLGFALGVQVLAYIVLILGAGGIAWLSFSRLDTVRPGTDEYETIFAGAIGATIAAAFVLTIAASALSAIVQGVVVREVAHAALAEKPTLRQLWAGFTPVAWRLVGYALVLLSVVIVIAAIVFGAILLAGIAAPAAAIGLTVVFILAAFPLYFWLSTKLLLAPAAIVLEHASIRQAIARSWVLTRGRFWAAFGVIIIVSLVFATVAQVVALPFSVVSMGLTTVIAPTGDAQASGLVAVIVSGVITQVVSLLVQSIALVVQGTASALVYLDCRMRHEGLDLDLLQYVERRDAGIPDLPDPYTLGIGRQLAPRPVAVPGYGPGFAPGYAPGYPPAPHPSGPAFAPQPYGAPSHPAAAYPPAYAAQPSAPPAYAGPQQPSYAGDPTVAPTHPAAGDGGAQPAPTSWTAPGQADDRERPWS